MEKQNKHIMTHIKTEQHNSSMMTIDAIDNKKHGIMMMMSSNWNRGKTEMKEQHVKSNIRVRKRRSSQQRRNQDGVTGHGSIAWTSDIVSSSTSTQNRVYQQYIFSYWISNPLYN